MPSGSRLVLDWNDIPDLPTVESHQQVSPGIQCDAALSKIVVDVVGTIHARNLVIQAALCDMRGYTQPSQMSPRRPP